MCHLEVSQIKHDWSNVWLFGPMIGHIITLQELEEAAELACANLLDSVKYMGLINLPLSNVDDLFTLWISSLSRKVR